MEKVITKFYVFIHCYFGIDWGIKRFMNKCKAQIEKTIKDNPKLRNNVSIKKAAETCMQQTNFYDFYIAVNCFCTIFYRETGIKILEV